MKKGRLLNTVLLITNTCPLFSATALDYHRYFCATYHQFRNEPAQSSVWYKKLLSAHTPISVYKGYIELLFSRGRIGELVRLIPRFKDTFTDDPDIQLIFAQALAQTGAVKQADELLVRAAARHKTHQELIFYTAQTYMRRKEPENALALIDTLLNSTPRNPSHYAFYFLKSQIYTSLNKLDQAIESITKSIAINPEFHKGSLMLALLYEKKKDITSALKIYDSIEQTSKSPLIKGQVATRITALKNGAASTQFPIIAQQPTIHVPKEIRELALLVAHHKYEKAFELLQTLIAKNPETHRWYEYLYQLSQKIGPNKILTFLLKLDSEKSFPIVKAYIGALYAKANELSKALHYFKSAFTKLTDPRLRTKIALQQARIYYRKKEFGKMVTCLEAGYKLGQNYDPLLNMLAYSYAKQNRNLDKALTLITKALEHNNQNPYYRDTKAFILYVQGEYGKAQQILEPLIEQIPTDTTILSHLSRTFAKQGLSDKAQDIAQRAYRIAKTSDEKQKWEKRIKEL